MAYVQSILEALTPGTPGHLSIPHPKILKVHLQLDENPHEQQYPSR